MRNYFLWAAFVLVVSMSIGAVLAAPLTDQVTPRNITFTESGTGIKNASRIAFSDGTSATSWSSFVTTTVLSTYQALVHGNFTALFTSDSSINATAVSALTGVGTVNSSYQTADSALTTRINTVNTTVQDLVNSNTSTNTRIDTINSSYQTADSALTTRVNTVNTTTQNLLTSNTSLYALVLQLGQNDTSINASITTLSTFAQTKASNATVLCANGTFLQNFTLTNSSVTWGCAVDFGSGGSAYDDSGIRTNVSNLQTSNASVYALILQLGQNDTNLNASINAVNTRVTTLNTTIQNLLTSNTSIYALILQLGQNDTNLNASINAVNTRVTTINSSLVGNLTLINTNFTDLQSSNTSTNTRITTINTTVQNLLSSNTSINTRVDTINTTVQNLLSSNTSINTGLGTVNASITTLSTFAQSKAATGYSGDCPYGIAGITLNNGSAANKTCAAAQSGGTGNITGGGLAGQFALFNATSSINGSAIYQNGSIIVIGSPDSDTGAGSQQLLEISRNGPRAQIDINDNNGANGSRLHLRSSSTDFYIGMNTTSPLFFENESGTWVMNLSHSGVLDVARNITVAGYAVLTNNSSIDFGQITGYSTALINTTSINATNSPSTGQVLTYAGSLDQFVWADDATGGGGSGSGNLTATTNGTLGYYAVFTNSTNVKNGSLYEDTSGNLASKRNINIKSDDGNNRAYQINGTDVVSLIMSSLRVRIGIIGRTIEWAGSGAFISDGGGFNVSMYGTTNNTFGFTNGDTGEAWLRVDDKFAINHTPTANSKALTVVGEANITSTVYLGSYTTCQTLGTNSLGQVLCQTNGSGSSFDPTPLQINDTYLNASINAVNTRVTTINTTVQNILTTNTTLFGLILQLGQNDTNLNASINAVNTRATSINATASTALQNVYAGSGITINSSGTGATIVASSGGGNVSGGSINGTSGFVAIWNSSTTITNSTLFVKASTGQVLTNNYGTVAAPAFSYQGNPDTGAYSDSAGQIMFSCDGVKCFQANLDGIQVQDGSATFPGIQSVNDDDTGPYWKSANVFAITAAGNAGGGEVVSFDSTRMSATKASCVGTSCYVGTNITKAAYSNTNGTTYTLIPELQITLLASRNYSIRCTFMTYSAAAATGEQLRVNQTGTPTKVTWAFNSQVSATTRTPFQGTSTSSNAFADTGSGGTNVRDNTLLTGFIQTSGSNSVLTFEMKTEIAASSATYDTGSYCDYYWVG